MKADLASQYHAYIACLNRQDWPALGQSVHTDVHYNGRLIGLAGYQAMLEQNYLDIPDLHFHIEQLLCEPPWVASRLLFDCTPTGVFLGLPVNGRRVSFRENVFYGFRAGRIERVWSVIDAAAIQAQL